VGGIASLAATSSGQLYSFGSSEDCELGTGNGLGSLAAPGELSGRVDNTVMTAVTALAAFAPIAAGLLASHMSGELAAAFFAASEAIAAAVATVSPAWRRADRQPPENRG
jgi:hypothetical protein